MKVKITLVLIVLVTTYLTVSTNSSKDCKLGWFGGNCQYMCHCTDNQCDEDGFCTGSANCVLGWFGPSCQYVDLAYVDRDNRTSDYIVRDGDDETCLEDNRLTIVLALSERQRLSWFRLIVKEPSELLSTFTLLYRQEEEPDKFLCYQQRKLIISETIVDVYCDVPSVMEITFEGSLVGQLCTVYVSGGRNVALKEKASQTSELKKYPPYKAVDGRTHRTNRWSTACAATDISDTSPSWILVFSQPRLITKVVVHNVPDCCPERLSNIRITGVVKDGISIYHSVTINDTSITRVVVEFSREEPIHQISISAEVDGRLSLCEVEAFGDSYCKAGKFGRDCEHTCNCAQPNETCLVKTGGCFSGCGIGFQGSNCSVKCPPTRFGQACKSECSTNCLRGQCHHINGTCQECPVDKKGELCDEDCPTGRYGDQCNKSCSKRCGGNGGCVSPGGICTQGCRFGYLGPTCNHLGQKVLVINDDLLLQAILFTLFVPVIGTTICVTLCLAQRKYCPRTMTEQEESDKQTNLSETSNPLDDDGAVRTTGSQVDPEPSSLLEPTWTSQESPEISVAESAAGSLVTHYPSYLET